MIKFRASYTNLMKWRSGDYEGFVKAYFKLGPSITTREMDEGKTWHLKWAKEIKKTKELPKLFGGGKLSNPMVENKMVVNIDDWIDFVFICDCYENNGEFIDFKTGVQNSGFDTQLGTQAVGLTLAKIKANRGHIYHYNQYNKDTEHDIFWITDRALKDSLNWIITLSSEAHEYLKNNNLYERFKK